MRIFKTAMLALGFMLAGSSLAFADASDHYQVGEFDVLALRDAKLETDSRIMPGLDRHPEFAGVFANGPIEGISRTFYFRDGDHRVLVDAGWGSGLSVKGRTAALLAEEGVKPDQITDILLTHLDHDHIGGLLDNGKPVYPHAALWISKPEYEAWMSGNVQKRKPEFVNLARMLTRAYKVRQFDFGEEILPGVTALDASGHTPGHTAYELASGNDRLIIAGDIMHVAPVQLLRPDLSSIYDMDPEKAAEARIRLLNRAAAEKALFAGMHMPMLSDVRKIESGGFVMKQPR